MSLLSRSSSMMRQGLKRAPVRPVQTRRSMAGGGHPPFYISEFHTNAGEYLGIFAWLWFLHRVRVDGPINMGWRHPWEHDGDHDDDHSSQKPTHETWDAFTVKAVKMTDDDDDDEEEEEDED